MTKKQEVDLETYRKRPRLLAKPMEAALAPGGGLHPVLLAVANDPRLRLDVRDGQFNIYYGGGSLMRVVGRGSGWVLHFDEKYFRGEAVEPPTLPEHFSSVSDAHAWVQAFPDLIAAMERWWLRHPRDERIHCQAIAASNSGLPGPPRADYLILDLEYQWAQRRFDMIAAKRKPSDDSSTGWAEPDLVFVEVKSDYRACYGRSGLRVHARDYRDIITARGGNRPQEIKTEYEDVVGQKVRLGLLAPSLGIRRFSPAVPELLVVFVDLNPEVPALLAPLGELRAVSDALGDAARIRFMRVDSSDYLMTGNAAVPPQNLVAAPIRS